MPVRQTMPMPSVDKLKNEIIEREKNEGKGAIELTSEYSIGDVKQAWNEYVSKADRAGEISKVIILRDRQIDVVDEVIHITLENELQKAQLNDFKEDLMVYIRNRIQNTRISIQAFLGEQQTTKKIYTTEEKFKFLEEKHPNLTKLKEVFGLETDYS